MVLLPTAAARQGLLVPLELLKVECSQDNQLSSVFLPDSFCVVPRGHTSLLCSLAFARWYL